MGWITEWRRKRVLQKHSIDDALWKRATRGLVFLPQVPKLRELVLLFLAEKQFAGAHGMEVTDEMRVAIAAQACLPILELGLDWYRGWTGIVVYAGDFRVRRSEVDEDGVVHEWDDELAGEAMPGGPVVLSWSDVEASTDWETAGMNLVIHEFAHKLDMRNGDANGFPPLHAGMDARAWKRAFSAAYDDFSRRVERADRMPGARAQAAYDALPLDPYAAESASEFFAVGSEAFFETPEQLAPAYPAVYEQLKLFYRQDPLARIR
jgi:Mlc titration factor MtfA (ptsG expression regulator)